ncbi:MAG: hypothetical protein NVS2B14_15900 [Chamaesiphon sp.]
MMKSNLKAKFLEYLNQKKQNTGFTMTELLMVIILIGILTTIALPSFLSQGHKSKQSEAKDFRGSLSKDLQPGFVELAAQPKTLPVPTRTPQAIH